MQDFEHGNSNNNDKDNEFRARAVRRFIDYPGCALGHSHPIPGTRRMTTTKFEGTPIEVGAEAFNKLCMPLVRQASNKLDATPEQLIQLYSGFICACLGAMAADFGQELATAIARVNVDKFQTTDLGEGARTQ